MNKQNLNLPVMVMHEVNDVQYKISGKLLSINEAAETCRIRFKNGREENIPVESIYITEGVFDKIRELGKKVFGWIAKKVKGLIAFCNEDGSIDSDSFNNLPNRAILQARGQFPANVKFYPSDIVLGQCADMGINISAPEDDMIDEESDERDAEEFNQFWGRIMMRVATTDETIGESIDYVKNRYYSQHINEIVIADIRNAPDVFGQNVQYGREVNTKELKALIEKTVRSQLHLSTRHESSVILPKKIKSSQQKLFTKMKAASKLNNEMSNNQFVKPLMIWGAPGVGKTAVIKQTLRDMRVKSKGSENLNIFTAACYNFGEDSFNLPAPAEKTTTDVGDGTEEVTRSSFNLVPLSWLPMYVPGDPEYNSKMEKHFTYSNHLSKDGRMMVDADGNKYTGGVLFLDEVVRAAPRGMTAIMGLLRREYQGNVLARNWAIIMAGNRLTDSPDQSGVKTLLNDSAFSNSLEHVTYVPTKEEWVEWAKGPDATGWRSRIDSKVVEFIERNDEKYWYRTVSNGGLNDEIQKAETSSDTRFGSDVANYFSSKRPEERIIKKRFKDICKTKGGEDSLVMNTVVNWTGRDWEAVSNDYRNAQMSLFSYDSEDELTGIITKGNLKPVDNDDSGINDMYDYQSLMLRSQYGDAPSDPVEEEKWIDKICNEIYEYRTTGITEDLYQEAVRHLKPGAWEEWVETNIPAEAEEILKTPVQKQKISSVMDKLLIACIREHTNTNNDDTNIVIDQMKADMRWKDIFTKDVIESIFDSGQMPKANNLYKDDYNNNFEWKSNPTDREEVFKYIMHMYPGVIDDDKNIYIDMVGNFVNDISEDVQKSLDGSTTAVKNVQSDIWNKAKKHFPGVVSNSKLKDFLQKKLTVDTKAFKNVKLIDVDKIFAENPYVVYIMSYLYNKSSFFKNMINYAKYVAFYDFSMGHSHFTGTWSEAKDSKKDDIKNFLDMIKNNTNTKGFTLYDSNVKRPIRTVMGNGGDQIFPDLVYIDAFEIVKKIFSMTKNMIARDTNL